MDSRYRSHKTYGQRQSTFIDYTPITNGQLAFTIDGSAHEIQGVSDVNIVLPNGSEQIIPQA